MTTQNELDILSERIASEGEHRINSFCNKLSLRFQPYADGLASVKDREMTLELGEALRTQMEQMLKILDREGITIK